MSSKKIIKEIDIDDPNISSKIAYFYELQSKIEALTSELEDYKEEFKEFEELTTPLMDSMKLLKDKIAKADKYIINIIRAGGEKSSYSYKTAFEVSLTKVNAQIRNILEQELEATKTLSRVKHSFKIDKLSESPIKGKFMAIINKLKQYFLPKIKGSLSQIDKANEVLEKLASKAESKSTSNPLDEQGVITKTSPDVVRLQATINKTPSLKTSGQYINTRAELVDAIPSVIATFGKELQSNKISLGTILSDIKKGLVKAGYK